MQLSCVSPAGLCNLICKKKVRDVLCIVYWCSRDAISKEIYMNMIFYFWICIIFAQILVISLGVFATMMIFSKKQMSICTMLHIFINHLLKNHYCHIFVKKRCTSLTKTDARIQQSIHNVSVQSFLLITLRSNRLWLIYLHMCPIHDFNMFLNYHLLRIKKGDIWVEPDVGFSVTRSATGNLRHQKGTWHILRCKKLEHRGFFCCLSFISVCSLI